VLNGLVNGVIVGGLYALLGLSLSLLYGVLRVVNFAHGELVIGGSFVAYLLFGALGLPPLFALPVAAVSFFAAGWGAYYLLIPRLSRSDDPETMSFLLMYGFSIALAATLLLLFGADSRSIDYSFNPISVAIGPVTVSTARIVALAVTVVVTMMMGWFLFRTLPGKALPFTIDRVTPVAVAAEGHNRFRAEARLEEPSASLRPGMTGVAKIDAGRRARAWIWTHETLDWLRLVAWSWGP